MRSFVVASSTAIASPEFLLADVPGTSGRMDVLARCIRAALLVSHEVRRDTQVYFVFGGGPRAPRTVRIIGGPTKFLRPDERAGAVLLQKILATDVDQSAEFSRVRDGISVARGGVEAVVADLGSARRFVLEENAPDVRTSVPHWDGDVAFLLGDHRGIEPSAREAFGDATAIGLGPISLHTEDAITVVQNELDRSSSSS
jgi:tRNA (pseudouridine54-N1)-methyltransferase